MSQAFSALVEEQTSALNEEVSLIAAELATEQNELLKMTQAYEELQAKYDASVEQNKALSVEIIVLKEEAEKRKIEENLALTELKETSLRADEAYKAQAHELKEVSAKYTDLEKLYVAVVSEKDSLSEQNAKLTEELATHKVDLKKGSEDLLKLKASFEVQTTYQKKLEDDLKKQTEAKEKEAELKIEAEKKAIKAEATYAGFLQARQAQESTKVREPKKMAKSVESH